MSENEKPTIPRPRFEHIALSESSTLKVNSWFEQINSKKKGVKISRKDFINWFIEKSPDTLSGSDLSAIIDRFYDEAVFLRQLLRDIKQAKANGKMDSGFELILKTRKNESKKDSLYEQDISEEEKSEATKEEKLP